VSYPIFKLFSDHRITHTLPTKAVDSASSSNLYWVAGRGGSDSSYILKAAVYNSTSGADVPLRVTFDGLKQGARAQLTVLTADEGAWAHNTPENKDAVRTTVTELTAGEGGEIEFSLPDLSVAVLVAGK
jgi:alpha-N-arabinofuranosidase